MGQTKPKKEIVEQILEVCTVSEEEAIDALAACNQDLELAIERLLAGKEYSWQKVSKRDRCFTYFTTNQLNNGNCAKEPEKFSKTNKRPNKAEKHNLKRQEGRFTGYSHVLNDQSRIEKPIDKRLVPLKEDCYNNSIPNSSKHQNKANKRIWRRKEKVVDRVNTCNEKYVNSETDDSNGNNWNKGIIHLLDSPSFKRRELYWKASPKEELDKSKQCHEASSNSRSHIQYSRRDKHIRDCKDRLCPTYFVENHVSCKSATENAMDNSMQKLEWSEDSSCRELRIRFGSLTVVSPLRCFTHVNENNGNVVGSVHFQSGKVEGSLMKSYRPADISLRKDFHIDSWNEFEGAKFSNTGNSFTNTFDQHEAEYPRIPCQFPDLKSQDEILNIPEVPKLGQEMEVDGATIVYHEPQMKNHLTRETLQNISRNGMIPSSASYPSNLPSITKNSLETSNKVPISLLPRDMDRTFFQSFNHSRFPVVNNEPSFGFHMPTYREKISFLKQNDMQEQSYTGDDEWLRSLCKENDKETNQQYLWEQLLVGRLSPVQQLHHQYPNQNRHVLEKHWK
ncbi:hypothetical protein Gasu2_55000 [Galdieria sulphuraria]|uniref:UBA domain-containing protein n=1 Tax=Galdieria sulphuraria TaxID=130081 RepID=M2XQE0_GALSU|nr:uncharacterized protein Gasu_65220 [Galdieria sulphuraria]EME25818.1 hypothetical protein Gasu_65220 [Galdieria sulphuraria]GJD11361.1 hypothetical protein Gasu2_55000 [Galdieria sulphuraria]|eukprot:XP_005702338.1 hypothetical protein Gasu_65220 [Galdieria sulphuraria]